jgi:hypothetical protein
MNNLYKYEHPHNRDDRYSFLYENLFHIRFRCPSPQYKQVSGFEFKAVKNALLKGSHY